ncbi:alpha/beta fold hydrolase [Gilvimarinus sp. 1_MG-2023]|uniref:alpha/beta fold hydrolase n=1 Tax=Gilvimarinus sp. 1_MG-2023 TaxID=3062638 RepID=UPI0026E1D455|nr:alpha/beta hydrolase [Gilvimarinus sp. 1_MG-2023]MDO6748163.1 alpha/beta hydrolase [Gilvimarinus sp. 1_MG-2023]
MNHENSEYYYARIDGHRIAYMDQGEGPVVILLHGIPTSGLLWRNIVPTLAQSHRVIVPDMLNYGRSDKPLDSNVSIAAQSDVLLRLMDALGIRSADLVAHDIGGGVAQILATRHPERINRLVLADAVCFDSWPIPEFEPLQKPEAENDMSPEELEKMLRDFLPQGMHNTDNATEALADMIVAPWQGETGKAAFFRNIRRLNPEYTLAIADDLANIQHKTLVLWGKHDSFQKPGYAEKLSGTLPNARIEWVESAHWITEEQPAEVARILSEFLAQ